VGSSEDCRRTIAEVIDQHGRLDVLVNNAGITIDKTVLNMTDEDWYKVIAVNLSGAFFMSQAVLPHMIERGTGRIINISSIIGSTGNIGQANVLRVDAEGHLALLEAGQLHRGELVAELHPHPAVTARVHPVEIPVHLQSGLLQRQLRGAIGLV
jgi:NAD(P)-dependent dehydrogenase (short-subunit alcohol dehydrogenase family)